MSKHNHGGFAQDVAYTVHQVDTLSEEEVKSLYGIERLADGKVFDPTYNQEFDTVGEWAEFCANEDMTEYDEHFSYEDEGYS